mmetsp:Transcript_3962/g.10087  ORF Transcript_3962/g.10087 Transcript_3962/m.10087 type:complete len:253 (-) Transcript_3962:468-1226(-)
MHICMLSAVLLRLAFFPLPSWTMLLIMLLVVQWFPSAQPLPMPMPLPLPMSMQFLFTLSFCPCLMPDASRRPLNGFGGHGVVVVDGGHDGCDELEEEDEVHVDPHALAVRACVHQLLHHARVLARVDRSRRKGQVGVRLYRHSLFCVFCADVLEGELRLEQLPGLIVADEPEPGRLVVLVVGHREVVRPRTEDVVVGILAGRARSGLVDDGNRLVVLLLLHHEVLHVRNVVVVIVVIAVSTGTGTRCRVPRP